MCGAALFSVVASLLIAGSIAFLPNQPKAVSGQVAAQQRGKQRLHDCETRVIQSRAIFNGAGEELKQCVDRRAQTKDRIAAAPNDLSLRVTEFENDEEIRQLYLNDYRHAQREWRQAVKTLEGFANQLRASSNVLEANRTVPAEFDFGDNIVRLPTELFPLQNVTVTHQQMEQLNLRVEQQLVANHSLHPQTIRQYEQLRGYLEEVEQKWGYRSPDLDQPRPEQREMAENLKESGDARSKPNNSSTDAAKEKRGE